MTPKENKTTYALRTIDGKLTDVHTEIEDDDGEEATEVTRLREELKAKIEASCERMDDVAKKADRLRKSVVDDRQSYPRMAAVMSDGAARPKK